MARISGINIPDDKRVIVSLTYVHGIGRETSEKILKELKISEDLRVKDLTEDNLAAINKKIVELQIPVEGELKRIVRQNIRRLVEIKSYRGNRHKIGLPVRGQSTKRNSRTKKGRRKTVGGQKRKLAKK